MTTYGIIGLGRTGSVLATALAAQGRTVRWLDPAAETAPADLGWPATLDEIRASDVIVECVTENRDAKTAVLKDLADTSAAVLTTTSSFTIENLATASGLGKRLAGFHFLASYGSQLAELTSASSDPDVQTAAATLAADLGLETLEVADRPGRISRRLLVPFMENVLRAVDLEIASPDDIDRVVELGLGHTVGPLRRLDAAGHEDHRAAAEALLPTIPSRND